MKPKPKTLEKSDRGFDSKTFWRHYVATVDTETEWNEDRPQPGRTSNRLFLFLLLFHIFLIGSVVLYNLVSERPKPVFVEITNPPRKSATGKPPVVPAKQDANGNVITAAKHDETVEHRVALGESLKSIADVYGATQDEISAMNHFDSTTQLAVGSVLRVPKPKAKPAVSIIPEGLRPALAEAKIVSVQTTTGPKTAAIFSAAEPAPTPVKTEPVTSKLPEERSMAKVEDTPPAPVKPKVTERPAVKVVEAPPAPAAKQTETKAVARKEAPPAPVAKKTETPAKSSETVKPTTAKPAEATLTHTVRPGETFYSISRKYGVKIDALMKLNGISDANKLRDGVDLKIPKE